MAWEPIEHASAKNFYLHFPHHWPLLEQRCSSSWLQPSPLCSDQSAAPRWLDARPNLPSYHLNCSAMLLCFPIEPQPV